MNQRPKGGGEVVRGKNYRRDELQRSRLTEKKVSGQTFTIDYKNRDEGVTTKLQASLLKKCNVTCIQIDSKYTSLE